MEIESKKMKISKSGLNILLLLVIITAILTGLLISLIYQGLNNVAFAEGLEVTKVRQVVEQEVIVEKEIVKEAFHLKEIGTFSLTAYCPCPICCEQYSAPPLNKTTSIGTGAYEGNTIAVDPNKIPYGTVVYIEDVGVRIASDCGGAIKGNKIDVYYEDHQEALESGLGHTPKKVYIIEESTERGN